MCLGTKFGKPTFFVTVTCNPKWSKIISRIPKYAQAVNRPDIVARDFYLTVKEIYRDLRDRGTFGRLRSFLHVIEFQKPGLPHAHILLWMEEEDILSTVEDSDNVICAESPCTQTNPRLHADVTRETICKRVSLQAHFRFDRKRREQKVRKLRSTFIGRIYFVPVTDIEMYCLRLLLITVSRATSFKFLLTVDGVQFATFKEAAVSRNLLADDSVWSLAMAEAVTY